MTIAIGIKVNDGVVLASDSAGSLVDKNGNIIKIYNNTNKLFNLHKELPLGVATYGLGAIGSASISTLSKDFRNRIVDDSEHNEWHINVYNYSLKHVFKLFGEFIFKEYYEPEFSKVIDPPGIGFLLGGYSSDSMLAELWIYEIIQGKPIGPKRLLEDPKEGGIAAQGQPESIERLLSGFDEYMLQFVLNQVGLEDDISQKVLELAAETIPTPLTHPAMPIQDAIDLAYMLANLAINYSRFSPGSSTVGGPIDLAAITKHEGFKWVKRKHYYNSDLNPNHVIGRRQ